MNLTIKRMIKMNNEKRKILTQENRIYYERILTFVRATSFKNEQMKEKKLLEMLDLLIAAQERGESAVQLFGNEPKVIANEIMEELPREPLKYIITFSIEIALTMMAVFLFIYGILGVLSAKQNPIYIGNTILSISIFWGTLIVLMVVIFTALQREAFVEKRSVLFTVYIFLLIVIGLCLLIVVNRFLPKFGGVLQLSGISVISVACLLFLVTFIMTKIREQR